MMFTHSAWLLRCSTFRNLLTVMSAEFCHIEQNPEAQFWIFFFLWANRLQKFQPADNATFRRNKNRNCKLHAHLETTFPIKLARLAKEYGILRRCATMLRDAWRSVSSCKLKFSFHSLRSTSNSHRETNSTPHLQKGNATLRKRCRNLSEKTLKFILSFPLSFFWIFEVCLRVEPEFWSEFLFCASKLSSEFVSEFCCSRFWIFVWICFWVFPKWVCNLSRNSSSEFLWFFFQ